jgi:hypothetical protein
MKLTTHFHLVPTSRRRGVIPPLPQYAFMAWCSLKSTGITSLYYTILYFTLPYLTLLYFTFLYFTLRNFHRTGLNSGAV